jgi:hypothetical protein
MQHSWGKPSRNGWRTIAMSSKSKHLHGALGSPMSFWLWYWCLARSVNIYISVPADEHTHTLVYTGLHWSCECHFCTFFLFLFFLLPWQSRSLHPLSMRGVIFRWNVRNISSSGRWNDWNDQLQNSDVWMYILYIYIHNYVHDIDIYI